jgi:DMSO/TMAO reductase YedYZ molybdopterin-dependent catalytic subunit
VTSPSSLTVDGEVEAPFTTADRTAALTELLTRARPRPSGDHATVHSGDDGYTASIPLHDLARGSLTDGRLFVEGGRTLCWNVKDVVRIEVTAGPRPDSVPENPPH